MRCTCTCEVHVRCTFASVSHQQLHLAAGVTLDDGEYISKYGRTIPQRV